MKVRELKGRVKDRHINESRNNILVKHKTIMGEMQDDLSKRSFVR
jgi:hypothetical protein